MHTVISRFDSFRKRSFDLENQKDLAGELEPTHRSHIGNIRPFSRTRLARSQRNAPTGILTARNQSPSDERCHVTVVNDEDDTAASPVKATVETQQFARQRNIQDGGMHYRHVRQRSISNPETRMFPSPNAEKLTLRRRFVNAEKSKTFWRDRHAGGMDTAISREVDAALSAFRKDSTDPLPYMQPRRLIGQTLQPQANFDRSRHSPRRSRSDSNMLQTFYPGPVDDQKSCPTVSDIPCAEKIKAPEFFQVNFDLPYPQILDPENPARTLNKFELRTQRTIFFSVIIAMNLSAILASWFYHSGLSVFIFILYIKSKDCAYAILDAIGLSIRALYRAFHPPAPVPSKWILTLIPTYAESEEQIIKAIFSLRDNKVEPHKQVMVVMIDGKPRAITKHLTRIIKSCRRPYVTSKFRRGDLQIDAGFIEDVPIIIFEKLKNAGKKDSLILCHDLFNIPRVNMPLYTKLLREEIWTSVLPTLTVGTDFRSFDMMFCTDADSTIHPGAITALANALARDKNAIAVCGLVLVELEKGREWSHWNLYQQYQYTFGQYVRRRAESLFGKVTCLPGCITMIAVRPEMAGAIQNYAAPITGYTVLFHQVQYLGTDRRLTYSMLSQNKKLRTLFVPEAVSETIAPQSLRHYLSQRRRWGSNAYFNDFFYCFGENMIIITRFVAWLELVRLTMVYYRIFNTGLFIYGLVRHFELSKLIPLLVVSELPTLWFFTCIILEPPLRQRAFKLALAFFLNKAFSPFLSVTVFTKVALNLGSQVWGMTGGSSPAPAATAAPAANANTTEDTEKPAPARGLHALVETLVGEPMNQIQETENVQGEKMVGPGCIFSI